MGQSEAVKSATNLILYGEDKLSRGMFLAKVKDKPWIYSPLQARMFLRTAADSKNIDWNEQQDDQEEEFEDI